MHNHVKRGPFETFFHKFDVNTSYMDVFYLFMMVLIEND